MKSTQLLSGLFLALTVEASCIPQPPQTPKALYFLDGNPAGSSVVALKIDSKAGTLSDPMRTATGGNGLIGNNAMGPVTADPLFSQDSLIVVGDKLFVVNSGSNTVSYFRIDAQEPWKPVLVSKPVSSGGTVPNTIAYSEKLQTACVANSGAVAGVQCYSVTNNGLKPAGSLMPLAVVQNSTFLGPPNTVSDALFNPDSTALFVTVKGDGTNPGYIYAFPVEKGCVGSKPVVSRPAGLPVDFSMTFITDRRAVISTPAYGASYVAVAHDLSVSVEKKIAVPGQKATCWTVYSPKFDSVYLFDGGSPDITTLDPVTGNTKFVIAGLPTAGGALDSVVLGDFLYTLQGSPGISVFSLAGSGATPKLVQSLDLSSFGNRAPWTGLAAYA